jgi:hypothetical protein
MKDPIENQRKKNVGVTISTTRSTTAKIIQPIYSIIYLLNR